MVNTQKQLNQKGAIDLLLVIAFVAIIGMGFFVYTRINESSSASQSTKNTVTPATNTNLSNNDALQETEAQAAEDLQTEATQTPTNQQSNNNSVSTPNEETNSNAQETVYSEVSLSNGESYVGELDTINSEYVRLSNIAYLVESGARLSVALMGQELHGPDSIMFIRKSKITSSKTLDDENVVISALKATDVDVYNKTTQAPTSSDINSYIRQSDHQGFFTNSTIYFGSVNSVSPSVKFVDSEAYELLSTGTAQASLSLKNIQSPELASNEIIYWQNLKSSGKVSQAIDSYINNGPISP